MTVKIRKAIPGLADKLQVIDLARTLSILSVLAYHLYGMPPASTFFQWFWKPFSGNGVYGVFVFFVVSGFLITRLIDGRQNGLFKPRLKEFYVRRAARILPLLLVHVSIGAFIVHGLTHFEPMFWVSILTFSFNWYQALHSDQIPGLYWGLLWSLSVEEQFYLFYPLVLKILGKPQRLVIFLAGVIVFGLVWRSGWIPLSVPGSFFYYKSSFGAFDQIAMGILLYLASQKYGPYLKARPGVSALFVAVGGALLVGTYGWTDAGLSHDTVYSPTLVALGAALTLLGALHLPIFESKSWVFMTWPGKFSYGIYLFHGLIYYLIFYPLLQKQSTVVAFFLLAVISTGVMAISFYFFELPVNRWVRRLFSVKA